MFPSHLNHMSSHCFFWRMNPDPKTRHVWHPTWSQIMCSRISWVFGGCLVCQYISGLSFLKKLAPIPPKKKNTHTPLGFFLTFFHTHHPPIIKSPPPPPKKTPAPPPPSPTKKKHTQKAAKPQQTNQPFRGFFFLMPLSTWIVTWRGNAAATAYPSHLRPRTQQRLRFFWGGEVEAGTLNGGILTLVKLYIDTAYVRKMIGYLND